MTCHPTEPCEKCPYRQDAPIGLWVKEHYELVIKIDHPFGGIFMCHKDKNNKEKMCAGWLLDQRNRGIPNLNLRMKLMREPDAFAALEEVNDGGHDMYEDAREMAEFNLEHGVFAPLCQTCGANQLEFEDDEECPWCKEKRREG